VTGGSVIPTMSFGVHLFEAGFEPDFQRKTASTVFCVIEGKGRTELEHGEVLEWDENDVFVVPSGVWYRHINEDPRADLKLYAVSDAPASKKLGFYTCHRRLSDGKVVNR